MDFYLLRVSTTLYQPPSIKLNKGYQIAVINVQYLEEVTYKLVKKIVKNNSETLERNVLWIREEL